LQQAICAIAATLTGKLTYQSGKVPMIQRMYKACLLRVLSMCSELKIKKHYFVITFIAQPKCF
jgi:hypothetical protein